jgi:DNA-binding XRE family transcriptional regulator
MQNQQIIESHPPQQRQRVLTTSVIRAADIMELRQTLLARILGISESTVSRMKAGRYLIKEESKEWELAALLVRLFRSLDAIVAGDERSLRSWLQNYNTALKEAPVNLITSISGLSKTVDYVDAYRAVV